MSLKFDSVEHEVIFHKLMEGLQHTHDIGLSVSVQKGDMDKDKYMGEIHAYINEMSRTRENRAHRYLHSHRRVIGPFIVFGKKVVRKLLKWYLDPVSNQQTEFNNAVTPALGRTTELLTDVMKKQSEIEKTHLNMISQLQQEYKQLQNEHTETLQAVRIMQTQYKQLVMDIEKEKSENKLQIESLEKMNQINVEQLEKMNDKLDKLDEMELFNNDVPSFFIKTSYSQSGEDSILAYIIRVLGIPTHEVSYIDMGANHAKEMSNTYYFYKLGARGVLVEANPELIPELKFYRHRDIILNNCVDTHSDNDVDFYIMNGDGLSTPSLEAAERFCDINPDLKIIDKKTVKTISYNEIISRYLGKAPDILSVDIEGKDIEILRSIDFDKYRPLIIITEMIEYSTNLAYHTKNSEISTYLGSKGYDEYAFTGINSIYVDKNYLQERAGTKE